MIEPSALLWKYSVRSCGSCLEYGTEFWLSGWLWRSRKQETTYANMKHNAFLVMLKMHQVMEAQGKGSRPPGMVSAKRKRKSVNITWRKLIKVSWTLKVAINVYMCVRANGVGTIFGSKIVYEVKQCNTMLTMVVIAIHTHARTHVRTHTRTHAHNRAATHAHCSLFKRPFTSLTSLPGLLALSSRSSSVHLLLPAIH